MTTGSFHHLCENMTLLPWIYSIPIPVKECDASEFLKLLNLGDGSKWRLPSEDMAESIKKQVMNIACLTWMYETATGAWAWASEGNLVICTDYNYPFGAANADDGSLAFVVGVKCA